MNHGNCELHLKRLFTFICHADWSVIHALLGKYHQKLPHLNEAQWRHLTHQLITQLSELLSPAPDFSRTLRSNFVHRKSLWQQRLGLQLNTPSLEAFTPVEMTFRDLLNLDKG
jgi:hypothetical protein